MNVHELIGYITITLACLAVSITLCTLCVQCIQNVRFLRTCRRDLVKRADGLRMHKMLGCLGMSTKGYVRKALWSEVTMHLNRCQQCTAATQCDAALAKGDMSQAGDFCPNFQYLVKLR